MTELEKKIQSIGAVDMLTLTQIVNELIAQHEEAKNTAWRVRMPEYAYNVGDKVIVPGVANFDKVLQCKTAGVTGSGDFPKSYDTVAIGNSIDDGSVQWQVVSLSQIPDLPDSPVTSVNSKTGDVVLTAGDIGALSTAGGTVTGSIISKGLPSIRQMTNDSYSMLMGGTNWETSASIAVSGGEHPNTAGAIIFYARTGTENRSQMVFYPSGSLTIDGIYLAKSIDNVNADATGNISLNALKKSGGNMTGKITFSVADAIYRNTDTATLTIGGGAAWNTGAWICLFGKDYNNGTDAPGMFKFAAQDGTNTSVLVGIPKGGLSWNSKDITLGYPNYAAAVTSSFASLNGGTYTAPADGYVTVVGTNTKDGELKVSVSGTLIYDQKINSDNVSCAPLIPVKAGDVIKAEVVGGANTTGYFKFFPNR